MQINTIGIYLHKKAKKNVVIIYQYGNNNNKIMKGDTMQYNSENVIKLKKKPVAFIVILFFILTILLWSTIAILIYQTSEEITDLRESFSQYTSSIEEEFTKSLELFASTDIYKGVITSRTIAQSFKSVSDVMPAAVPYVDTGEFYSGSAFIGNSRTQGLDIFTGMPGAVFYTDKGLDLFSVHTSLAAKNLAGEECTIIDALKEIHYDKIFIMLGINELAWHVDPNFISEYQKLVDIVKQLQPQATIYVQSILPVSQWKDSSHEFLKNVNIESYNTQIKDMCTTNNLVYLDVASIFKDETGALFSQATTDGIHLTAEYCLLWEEYLNNYPY